MSQFSIDHQMRITRNWQARFASVIMKLNGWVIEGHPPDLDKWVLIAAPHTSNWDGFFMIMATFASQVDMTFFAKQELFFWPLGPILRWMGGVSIRRDGSYSMVDQVVQAFNERDALCVAIPAEGTRSYTPYWKTGFYYIALGAGVPVCLGKVDWAGRRMFWGPLLHPSGDIEADFDIIREWYADMTAAIPGNISDIRTRAEWEQFETELASE